MIILNFCFSRADLCFRNNEEKSYFNTFKIVKRRYLINHSSERAVYKITELIGHAMLCNLKLNCRIICRKLTSISWLSVLRVIDLETSDDPVLPVLVGEHDTEGERGVGDVVVKVVLQQHTFLIKLTSMIS